MSRADRLKLPRLPITRFSRHRFLRKASRRDDGISLGLTYDDSCRIAAWAHLDHQETNGSYYGVAVTYGRINFQPERGRPSPDLMTRTDILIDLSVILSLSLSLGANDLISQIEVLRPAVSWCALANEVGNFGRFVVPVTQGLFICTRGRLPVTTKDDRVMGARIVAFHALKDMRKQEMEYWRKLQSLHMIEETPGFPDPTGFCVGDARRLTAMMDLDAKLLRELKPYPAATAT